MTLFRKAIAVLAIAIGLAAGAAAPAAAVAPNTVTTPAAVLAGGVIDCTPQGASWPDWTNMGNPAYAAGRICGDPNASPPSPGRTWDKKADGLCASLWFRINPGATVYKITPTEACGVDVIKAGWTPSYAVNNVYLVSAPAGHTSFSTVNAWIQLY
jgi:hypothetical protein